MPHEHSYAWSLALVLPAKLRTTVLNYLNFFHDYALAVSGLQAVVDVETRGDNIICTFRTDHERSRSLLERMLQGYMERIFNDTLPELRHECSRYEADLFLVLYKRALADIRTDIRYNFMLLSDEEQSQTAMALALLSTTDEGRESQHRLDAGIDALVAQIHALQMPSERQELPESLKTHVYGHSKEISQRNERGKSHELRLTMENLVDLRDDLVDLADELARAHHQAPVLARRIDAVTDDIETLLSEMRHATKTGEMPPNFWRLPKIIERMDILLRDDAASVLLSNKSAIVRLCTRLAGCLTM